MNSAGRRRVALVAAGASVAFAVGLALLWRAPYAHLDGLSVRALFGELGRAMLANDRALQAAVMERVDGWDLVQQRLERSREYLQDGDVDVRRGAVSLFGAMLFKEALSAYSGDQPEHRRLMDEALALVEDEDEWIRVAMTVQWTFAWRPMRERVPVPDVVFDAIRAQLRSPDTQTRTTALVSASQLGVDAATLLEDVLGAGAVGEGESFRASALGAIGIGDERVLRALRGLLGHRDANVRWSAADAFGDLSAFDPSLLVMLDNEAEDTGARRAALGALSLAELVPDDVARALRAALAARSLSEDDNDGMWAIGVGRLAARTQDEDLRTGARDVFVELLAADDARSATVARASLLRIAVAIDDDDAVARHSAELQDELRSELETARRRGADYYLYCLADVLVEALLDALAARGPGVVDADLLRAVLEQHVAHGYDYQRAWAREQLARLPG